MDNKFVITIGRQFGSCGKEIGNELAKRFGIAFYDKELIAAGFTFGPFQYNDFLSNDKLFQIQSDVIRKVAGEHSCVIVGRCADYILRDNKRCINVFVHAGMEERVKTVMNRQHISEQEARELIRKMDKTRPNYYNFYSDKEWGVASSYHLSVDSGLLGVHKTVDFIQKFVEEALKDK